MEPDRKLEEQEDSKEEVLTRPTPTLPPPSPKMMKRSQKMTKVEIEQRRKQVRKLRLRGLSISNIAKLLTVSVGTIQRDLDAIVEESRKELANFTPNDYLAEDKAFYDELIELGYSEFMSAKPNTPQRIRALEFLRQARGDRRQAYKDCGLIQNQDVNVQHEVVYNLPWNDDVQKVIAVELLKRSLSAPPQEPQLDTNIVDIGFEAVEDAKNVEVDKTATAIMEIK